MSTPVFNRVAGGIYLAASTPADAVVRSMLWIPSDSSTSAEITLEQAWSQGAVSVIAAIGDSQVEDVLTQVPLLLAQPEYANVRFLWIANPESPWTAWELQAIIMNGDKLAYPVALTLRNYAIHLPAFTDVELTETGWRFGKKDKPSHASLSNQYGALTLDAQLSQPSLEVDGQFPACISF